MVKEFNIVLCKSTLELLINIGLVMVPQVPELFLILFSIGIHAFVGVK